MIPAWEGRGSALPASSTLRAGDSCGPRYSADWRRVLDTAMPLGHSYREAWHHGVTVACTASWVAA